MSPIPGTTKISHLDDNVAAAVVHLGADDRALVAAVVPAEAVRGNRFAGDDPTAGTYRANL